jgi:hypothetical protein
METVIFQCDFCGTRSEEESAVWRRQHCSVELVLRGSRFSRVAGSHSLYGVPFTVPEIEDERWAASLCDRCMKRVSALFGINLETPEEARWRQEQLAHSVAKQAAYESGAGAGMRGVMTDQFLTPDGGGAARTVPFAPVAVIQYPTPKRAGADKGVSPDDVALGTLEREPVEPDSGAEADEGKS